MDFKIMFAFLAPLVSKIGGYLILLLVVCGIITAGYFYYEHQKAEIATLTQNVATLQTSNNALNLQMKHLQDDMALVQKAQDAATVAINKATTQSAVTKQKIKSENLVAAANSNSPQLETQINADFANTFSTLQGLTK